MTLTKAKYTGLEVAIIGMSGRFPGAVNIHEFWENIREGKESLQYFSDEELLKAGHDSIELASPLYVKSGCFLDNPHYFDSNFFNYPPHEAALIDPQVRMFHECVWSALEDSGNLNKIKDIPVALFSGASDNSNWRAYQMLNQHKSEVDSFSATQLSDAQFMSTLVSYKLDLRGPSLYVNTACSTSLVAIHMACRSLITGEAKMAIAGGVKFHSSKRDGYLYEDGGISSKDGHCKAFNSNSSGTMGGEGVAAVVLKKLQDAITDGDRIYAVIKGSATNNDGKRKVGYTAPSVEGQAECIRIAHKVSRIEPGSVSYIESHGTGTALGDPIEIMGLKKAFGQPDNFSCAIGAVKSNIGHLDAAAGIAGLIKATLALWKKELPPSVFYDKPIAELKKQSGFYLNDKACKWTSKNDLPLRAGVNSFGIGGTNAHVVLEEAPDQTENPKTSKEQVICISAKTPNSTLRYIDELKKFLEKNKTLEVADIAYTLEKGRQHFNYRKSFVCKNTSELFLQLNRNKHTINPVKSNDKTHDLIFVFSGAGSQYANMGLGLYENEPVFKQVIDTGLLLLEKNTGINYKKILYPEDGDLQAVNDMLHTQPLIFLFEYALAKLMMSYGLQPSAMIGHSIGEYAAACISGVFSFEDALSLVIKRGELMNTMQPGAMLSVNIREDNVKKYLTPVLSVAAVNGPEQIVFSGNETAVNELIEKLDNEDISCVKLYASHAGHSHMIDGILDDYQKCLEAISMAPPAIPFISNLNGQFIKAEEAVSVKYWLRHMRETVRFSDGLNALSSKYNHPVFIEIGPGHALASIIKQQFKGKKDFFATNLVKHPKEQEQDTTYLYNKIGQLWEQGVGINLTLMNKNEKNKLVSLPTYMFEKINYPAIVNLSDFTQVFNGDQSSEYIYELEKVDNPVFVSSQKFERPSLTNLYVAPVTETEIKLSVLLGDLFGIEGVGTEDNFFELGGDSLKAMIFIKRIKKELSVQLTIKDFFAKPNMKELSAEIDEIKFLMNKKERNSKTII